MPAGAKTIRVFISSTFEDLKRERDILQRDVFPLLIQRCQARGARFQAVDLRWGVRREAALDQRTMDLCLREIERCQRTGFKPSFVILLGSRYGWCPLPSSIEAPEFEALMTQVEEDADRSLLFEWYRRDENAVPSAFLLKPRVGAYGSDESWLPIEGRLRHILQRAAGRAGLPRTARLKCDTSATHQEILHGLEGDDDAGHVFAFCRSSVAGNEDPSARELKEFVRQRLGDRAIDYAADDLTAFSSAVLGALTVAVDAQLAAIEAASPMDAESAAQTAFASERSSHFRGRDDVLSAIADYLGGSSRCVLAVVGEAGSGKSAIMARSSQLTGAAHPAAVITRRFIGATPGASDGPSLLRSLCLEIGRHYGEDQPVPSDFNELLARFADTLRLASDAHPLIIFVDALDQLESGDPARSLSWIPAELPPSCKFVVSAIDGTAVPARAERVGVGPLEDQDADVILSSWLADAHRILSSEQRAVVLERFATCRLPLFLRLAFEEARRWHSFDPLSESTLGDGVDDLIDRLLDRLSDDTQHGRILVEQSLAYLTASSHGLTEDEILTLLSADDEVWQDFEQRAHHDPPDRRLPAVVWSRLYADLEPYLSERQTIDGEMIGFYHRQVRDRFRQQRLDASRTIRTHRHLASYFRSVGDPGASGEWSGPGSRGRRELPFHLAHAREAAELDGLLSSLSYLNARVRSGEAFDVLSDYRLLGNAGASTPWGEFLHRHTQRLTQHPDMLVSLTCHEGFPAAREQALSLTWSFPWVRTWPEPRPQAPSSSDGLRCDVESIRKSPTGQVKASAEAQQIVVFLEKLGSLGLLSLPELRQLQPRLTIRRERPLSIACAPNATSIVVFFESGVLDLYHCARDDSGIPVVATCAASFQYKVPAIDDPVVDWRDGAFWFQASDTSLARIDAVSGALLEEPFPAGVAGELAAFVVLNVGRRLITLRQGRGAVVLSASGAVARFEETDLCAACACGHRAAFALGDGRIIVIDPERAAASEVSIRTDIPQGAIGWDGERVLWVESDGFRAWKPDDTAATVVQDDGGLFPPSRLVVPHLWTIGPTGSMLLLATHKVALFRISDGGGVRSSRVERLFGGPVWRAVRMREHTQLLWEGEPCREIELTTTATRLYGSPDGRDLFYALEVEGRGAIWNLSTLKKQPVPEAPMALNVSQGDPDSGCWYTDRSGDIFHLGPDGVCRKVASIGGDSHGGTIHVCGEYLMWRGYAPHFDDHAGMDQSRLFVLFRRVTTPTPRLDRIGERRFAVREGLCIAMDYAPSSRRFAMLWHVEGGAPVLRTGSMDDFMAGTHVDYPFPTDMVGHAQMSFSPSEREIGIVTEFGDFLCVSASDGHLIARLESSADFSHIAAGKGAHDFWLVEARDRIFGCTVMGPS